MELEQAFVASPLCLSPALAYQALASLHPNLVHPPPSWAPLLSALTFAFGALSIVGESFLSFFFPAALASSDSARPSAREPPSWTVLLHLLHLVIPVTPAIGYCLFSLSVGVV